MNSSEFREVLAARISPEEREVLSLADPGLYISEFNRSVCMRIIGLGQDSAGEPDVEQDSAAEPNVKQGSACEQDVEQNVDGESCVDLESAEELEESLRTFLDEYMSDHPEAHKWIILSCLELTFVEKQPMHPQKSAKWVSRDGHYYCPSMNKDSIICRYCACEAADSEASDSSSNCACEAADSSVDSERRRHRKGKSI